MSYYLAYGSYHFPATFHPADDPLSWQVGQAKLARADGAQTVPGYLNAKRLVVAGAILRGPLTRTTVVRNDFDDLKAALALQPQNLYFDSDRYWRCVRVEEMSNPYEDTHYGRLAMGIRIQFLTGDPFQYSTTLSADTWTVTASGQTRTITPSGNAPALADFSLTVAGSGAKTIAWTFTNSTTGESFTLAGDVNGGDVIVVDSLLKQVTISGSDYMSLFEGTFPRMDVGANTLTESYSGTAIGQVLTEWRDRWR